MRDNSNYYSQVGIMAARKAARFPGLGQLANGETLKGTVIIALFTFSVALSAMIVLSPTPPVGTGMLVVLLLLPPAIWGISIFDAYRVAIEQRKRDAKRFNLQIMTTLRGIDLDNNSFEELTMTRNVSRMGACLVLSRAMHKDSPVSLEFEGKERVRGRVVWAKQTGNEQEHLVGMELMAPLRQFEHAS